MLDPGLKNKNMVQTTHFFTFVLERLYIYTKITNIQGGVWGIHLANLRFTRIVMKVPCMILLTSLL